MGGIFGSGEATLKGDMTLVRFVLTIAVALPLLMPAETRAQTDHPNGTTTRDFRVTGSVSQVAVTGEASEDGQGSGAASPAEVAGTDALAWALQSEFGMEHTNYWGISALRMRAGYGEVRDGGAPREAVDRLTGEATYELPIDARPDVVTIAPFLGVSGISAWTAPTRPDGTSDERPLSVRVKAGVTNRLGKAGTGGSAASPAKWNGVLRISAAGDWDRLTGVLDYGFEIAQELKRQIRPGVEFTSRGDLFLSNHLSLRQYTHIDVSIVSRLSIAIDGNLFLHHADHTQTKTEILVGLGVHL